MVSWYHVLDGRGRSPFSLTSAFVGFPSEFPVSTAKETRAESQRRAWSVFTIQIWIRFYPGGFQSHLGPKHHHFSNLLWGKKNQDFEGRNQIPQDHTDISDGVFFLEKQQELRLVSRFPFLTTMHGHAASSRFVTSCQKEGRKHFCWRSMVGEAVYHAGLYLTWFMRPVSKLGLFLGTVRFVHIIGQQNRRMRNASRSGAVLNFAKIQNWAKCFCFLTDMNLGLARVAGTQD